MKCYRCGSMMVAEKFYLWHEHFSGWRCIGCGEIVDPLILENRTRPRRTIKGSMQKQTEVIKLRPRAR
jgi:hypothetical protein